MKSGNSITKRTRPVHAAWFPAVVGACMNLFCGTALAQALVVDGEQIADAKIFAAAKKEGKGNFELLSEDGTLKVEFSVQAKKAFDERAGEAEQLLKEFLKSVIKGRNSEAYKLVSTLLERKIDGDYDIKLIQRLYKMENDYDNETWRRAIQLFKEAYKEIDSARYVRFYKKTDSGPWTLINLSFSGL